MDIMFPMLNVLYSSILSLTMSFNYIHPGWVGGFGVCEMSFSSTDEDCRKPSLICKTIFFFSRIFSSIRVKFESSKFAP